MDDSQSSDVFAELSEEVDHRIAMGPNTYKIIMSRLKTSLCKDKKGIAVIHFNDVLKDCKTCVDQCISAILSALEESNIDLHSICNYLEDAIYLLQMLSNFIKSVMESIALVCSSMKSYPTITGHIILSVFSHCKESECLYGVYINRVEKQLKDLFRACHELQLTYLLSMEKQFTFDLSEQNELEVLLEALNINLKIGEVVQALDIKTMAEQWKAYSAICEKYSSHLLDKHIYNKCTKLFIEMIRSNMKMVLEVKDDKAILRSVKVASFGVKILSKLFNIFKKATNNEHEGVIDTIIYLFTFNNPFLELIEKSQLSRQIELNVIVSLEVLLNQLIDDKKFLHCVCNIVENNLIDEAYYGYIILLATVMKRLLNINTELGDIKMRIVKCIFRLLPLGHVWLNMGLRLKISKESDTSYGLFEYLLTGTLAFTRTFNSEEFSMLERILFENLLNTDFYSATFASNLWVMLLRSCDPILLSNTLMSLLKVYQKLTTHKLFHSSPQEIYLRYTLRKLFQLCSQQDKLLIYKQYNMLDKDNLDVWVALRISNLPLNMQVNAEYLVLDKLSKMFNSLRVDEDNIDHMIKLMNLAATCTHKDNNVLDLLMRMWRKACRKCNFEVKDFDESSIWYFKYLEGLIAITDTVRDRISKNIEIEIFNIMGSILLTENTALVYLLLPIFCELYDRNFDTQSSLLNKVFEKLLLNSDFELHQYIFCVIESKSMSSELNKILQQDALQDVLTEFNEYKILQNNFDKKKNRLKDVEKCSFAHKCMKSQLCSIASERSESNFELADIDSLFDNDSDNEPVSKKAKLNVNQIEDLISRIEKDASLLCDIKENVLSDEHKMRISNVCAKLKNKINH